MLKHLVAAAAVISMASVGLATDAEAHKVKKRTQTQKSFGTPGDLLEAFFYSFAEAEAGKGFGQGKGHNDATIRTTGPSGQVAVKGVTQAASIPGLKDHPQAVPPGLCPGAWTPTGTAMPTRRWSLLARPRNGSTSGSEASVSKEF